MKAFFLLAAFYAANAQANDVVLAPRKPVNCSTESHDYINRIGNIRMVENTTHATLSFTSVHGSCENGIFQVYPINRRADSILDIVRFKNGRRWPWGKSGVTAHVEVQPYQSGDEAQIQLVFEKSVAFSEGNVGQYEIRFEPVRVRYYIWNVYLKRNGNKTKIVFTSAN